jgi:glyoxylase-like metal-dependent hydrolase (beta-lactamase superfamily II)
VTEPPRHRAPVDLDPASPADIPAEALAFPYPDPPEAGQVARVADGVYWLRMPLPFSLEHINLWLLEARDQWTIVDTGIASDRTRELWSRLAADVLGDRPVTGVLCTHMHPDHVGLAGWLCERFAAPLSMTREEYLYARAMLDEPAGTPPAQTLAFYRAAGFDARDMDSYAATFGFFAEVVAPLPRAFVRLRDGDRLSIAGREWRVLVGRGHSPEHACLHCPQLGVIIAGDQILPHISSNVSVWPTEPGANPLDEWLNSLAALRAEIPEDTLVLPSHGLPFVGAARRLSQLIDHHKAQLDALYRFCRRPCRAVDTFEVLFHKEIPDAERIIATGEALAHLRHLERRRLLRVDRDAQGVDWYSQA